METETERRTYVSGTGKLVVIETKWEVYEQRSVIHVGDFSDGTAAWTIGEDCAPWLYPSMAGALSQATDEDNHVEICWGCKECIPWRVDG